MLEVPKGTHSTRSRLATTRVTSSIWKQQRKPVMRGMGMVTGILYVFSNSVLENRVSVNVLCYKEKCI